MREAPPLPAGKHFVYHGTFAYAVWSIIEEGILLESHDKNLGHEEHTVGAYATNDLQVPLARYARPACLFDDFAMFQFVLRLVPGGKPETTFKNEGGQEVFKSERIKVHSLLVKINGQDFWTRYGDVVHWKFNPLLEAHPHRLPKIVSAYLAETGAAPELRRLPSDRARPS